MSVSLRFVAATLISLLVGPVSASAADLRPMGRQSAAEVAAAVAGHDRLSVRPVAGRVKRSFRPPATRYGAGHRGVDLAAQAGEPVVAALGGTVTFAGAVAGIPWVTVDHGGGLRTTYGPVAPRVVGASDVVAAGEVLGFLAAGGTHLDWGARLGGEYIDPLSLLGGWETFLTSSDDVVELPALGGPAAAVGPGSAAPGRLRVPTPGPITSGFGPRVHPVTGDHRLHAGIDIGATAGRPIRAAGAGTVSFAGVLSGYGNTVVVDHGGGVTTLYAHQSTVATNAGKPVAAGELLGRVGSSGLSTGPHLHFEVRVDGAPQNPMDWLSRKSSGVYPAR